MEEEEELTVSQEFINYLLQLKQYNYNDKNEMILFIETKVVPQRLRGKEFARERRQFINNCRKFKVQLLTHSTAQTRELVHIATNSILIYSNEVIRILNQSHNIYYHRGRNKMLSHLKLYYFKKKKEIVKNYLLQCAFCVGKPFPRNFPLIQPIISKKPRERLCIDLFEMPRDSSFY